MCTKNVTIEYISEKQRIYLLEKDLQTTLSNKNRLEEDLRRALLRAERNFTNLAF